MNLFIQHLMSCKSNIKLITVYYDPHQSLVKKKIKQHYIHKLSPYNQSSLKPVKNKTMAVSTYKVDCILKNLKSVYKFRQKLAGKLHYNQCQNSIGRQINYESLIMKTSKQFERGLQCFNASSKQNAKIINSRCYYQSHKKSSNSGIKSQKYFQIVDDDYSNSKMLNNSIRASSFKNNLNNHFIINIKNNGSCSHRRNRDSKYDYQEMSKFKLKNEKSNCKLE